MGAAGMFAKIIMFANLFVGSRLRGRRGDFYGISALYRKDPKPFREDMPKIFELLSEKKIDPVIKYTFPLLEARKAIELLISGAATGKIVLNDGASLARAETGLKNYLDAETNFKKALDLALKEDSPRPA